MGRTGYLKLYRFRNYELVYMTALVFYVLSGMLASSMFGEFELPESFRFIRFAGTIVLLMISLLIRGTLRNLIAAAAGGMIFVLTIISAGSVRELILILIFLIAAEDMEHDRIFTVLMILMAAFLFIIIALDHIGYFDKYMALIENVDRKDEGEVISRAYLGFDYPSMAPSLFFTIVMLFCYADRDKTITPFFLAKYVFIILVNSWMRKLTDTRGVYYTVMLMVAGMFFIKLIKLEFTQIRLFRFLIMAAYPIFAAVCLYIQINYQPEQQFYSDLNTKLSLRLHYTKKAIDLFGVHPFGSEFEWKLYGYRNSSEYVFVDCSYWNVIIRYGIVLFVLLMLIIMLIMKYSIDTKNTMLAWLMVVVGVHSCIDPQLFNLIYTPFLLLAGNAISYYWKHRDILAVSAATEKGESFV